MATNPIIPANSPAIFCEFIARSKMFVWRLGRFLNFSTNGVNSEFLLHPGFARRPRAFDVANHIEVMRQFPSEKNPGVFDVDCP
jgi:hypothetical protein